MELELTSSPAMTSTEPAPKHSWVRRAGCGARGSTPLAAQDLSPLLVGETDHFAVSVTLEAEFETDGFGDEDVRFDGRELKGPLVGTLHKELGVHGEDAQRVG